jgi:phytanoyl-CoA hydroxylase
MTKTATSPSHDLDLAWATGTDADAVDGQTDEWYRHNGFVRINSVLSRDEVDAFRTAAIELMEQTASYRKDKVLDQRVNVWRQETPLRQLTLHPRLAALAERLAGVPMRLWHDQLLVKPAGDSAATEFHQDQPYWPHCCSSPVTAWVALVDVPVERGCMSFLPGTQRYKQVPRHELEHEQGLFDLVPELAYVSRVTVPLRAGDCTFHHGRTGHFAGPNRTNEARLAHAIIYMDADATYAGTKHVITDPLGLTVGQVLDHELFPLAQSIVAGSVR